MQISPPADSFSTLAMREPRGWSPGAVAPAPSTRAEGLLKGGFAAWRGVPEAAAGVALTAAQVSTLAPFLANQFGIAPSTVTEDLERVRIQVGGVAAGAGNVATTIGHHIYVSDASWATRILAWPSRSWLVHELAHTMQWRRVGDAAQATTDAQRDRAFLNTYVGAYVGYDGTVREGGFAKAIEEIVKRRREQQPIGGIGTILHDTHPMEVEASAVASAFVAKRSATA